MTRPARTLRRSLAALSLGLMALATLAALLPAQAQAQNSITIVREVDSNNYDPHKSTARAAWASRRSNYIASSERPKLRVKPCPWRSPLAPIRC